MNIDLVHIVVTYMHEVVLVLVCMVVRVHDCMADEGQLYIHTRSISISIYIFTPNTRYSVKKYVTEFLNRGLHYSY